MSGAAIARELLMLSTALFSAVPSARVFAGIVPQGTAPPCVGITEVVSTDHSNVRGFRAAAFGDADWWTARPITKVTERVQVTVIASSYVECKSVMKQARRALRDFHGDIGAFKSVTCRLDGQGPDFQNDAGFCAQTQDLRITYDESNIS